MRATGYSANSFSRGVNLGKPDVPWVPSCLPPIFSFGAFQYSLMSPLDICYFCNSKNLNVLRATRVPWTLGGGKTGAPDTPPPSQPDQHLGSARSRGRGLPSTRFSPMGPGVRDQVVVAPGMAGGADRGGKRAGITAWRAHLPGAAGLHAAARTDVPLPPRPRCVFTWRRRWRRR